MHPSPRGQSEKLYCDPLQDNNFQAFANMNRPHTPPNRLAKFGADTMDSEPRPHSSPFSDYFTESPDSPTHKSMVSVGFSRAEAEAMAYLFSPSPDASPDATPSRSRPGPSNSLLREPSALASPTQRQLLFTIHNIESFISGREPKGNQLESILSSLDSINATLTAPESQSRQPIEELIDSGMFMSDESHEASSPSPVSDDGRSIFSSSLQLGSPPTPFLGGRFRSSPPFVKPASYTRDSANSDLRGGLGDSSQLTLKEGYAQQVQELANEFRRVTTELSKRFDEIKTLNQLSLDRNKIHHDVIAMLREMNDTQTRNLHLDHAELVFLRLELDAIKSIEPSQLGVGENFPEVVQEAIRQAEVNWSNTERRFVERLAEDRMAKGRLQELEEEVTTEQQPRQANPLDLNQWQDKGDETSADSHPQAEVAPAKSSRFWGALSATIDWFGRESGWFPYDDDED